MLLICLVNLFLFINEIYDIFIREMTTEMIEMVNYLLFGLILN
jgi:hypothetical protein